MPVDMSRIRYRHSPTLCTLTIANVRAQELCGRSKKCRNSATRRISLKETEGSNVNVVLGGPEDMILGRDMCNNGGTLGMGCRLEIVVRHFSSCKWEDLEGSYS